MSSLLLLQQLTTPSNTTCQKRQHSPGSTCLCTLPNTTVPQRDKVTSLLQQHAWKVSGSPQTLNLAVQQFAVPHKPILACQQDGVLFHNHLLVDCAKAAYAVLDATDTVHVPPQLTSMFLPAPLLTPIAHSSQLTVAGSNATTAVLANLLKVLAWFRCWCQ